MYDIFRIQNGAVSLVEPQREFEPARNRAKSLSAIENAVFYIERTQTANPIVYFYRGVAMSAHDVTVALTNPAPKPVVRLEPPAPENLSLGEELAEEIAQRLDDVTQEFLDTTEPKRARRPRRLGPEEIKAKTAGPNEYKQFEAVVTDVNEAEGLITAIVSVTGIIDDGDDIIHAGSFIKTIAENFGRLRVLNSHNSRDVLSVIGKPVSAREISRDELPANVLAKYPEATGGLETITQYMKSDERSWAVFQRLREGYVNEYSIGFDIMQADNSKVTTPDGKSKVVRNIRQLRLWEYSPVIWGMNPATGSVSVKDGEQEKEMTPDGPVRRLGDVLMADLTDTCNRMMTGCLRDGVIDGAEHAMLTELCRRHTQSIYDGLPEDISLREMPMMGMDWIFFGKDGAETLKAGRVLSESNYSKIKQANDLLNEVMSNAGMMDDETTDKSSDEMLIELPSVPEQLINDGPLTELMHSPTSDEAGPGSEQAPSDKQAELLARMERLLATED